jgi:hypothetical protein
MLRHDRTEIRGEVVVNLHTVLDIDKSISMKYLYADFLSKFAQ